MESKINRDYINFSTHIDDIFYYTQINLTDEVIHIVAGEEKVYSGSISEFKELEKLKAKNYDKVYHKIVIMIDELITILTKK